MLQPNNSGGFDFGAILDSTLKTYQAVSIARAERDVAKYQLAGATQQAALHGTEGYTASEAYNVGVAGNGSQIVRGNASGGGSAPINANLLMYGGLALVGGLLVWKALK
ncbi:hypothetical protein [Cellvibrio sp. QJXJ]|uniref:hypothetical protein n=1 Tax=Cellvibrio sp. QJXJ TaxID=2964606 RepID=UPI0021C322DD|nr:hypothetical protein [Cellvibrio sp. QJXJ]UUA73554.1 hypothetical protein NNX04_03685 [Cellvibrio sp. QJXJ]